MRACAVLALGLAAHPVFAQARAQASPPPPPGAHNNTELSLVVTAGNAQSNTVGFRNVYTYRWVAADLSWETGWIRAASRNGHRFAVARPDGGFDVIDPGSVVDSQRLFTKFRYQQKISGRYQWFASTDAVRDTPANINGQFVLAGGFGTTWVDSDRFSFRTLYGITYTREDLMVEGVNQFGGYRLFYGLKTLPTPATTVESELTADGSFDTTDDIRTDWLNGVSVAINSTIALKSSVRVLFRNLPALETIDLVAPGTMAFIGTVDIFKRKVDTTFTTSLVIKF